jgi:DNA-binding MarR family transcriptional regulator
MTSRVSQRTAIDVADPDVVRRIGLAWVELRRGPATRALRDYLIGDTELEQGQMDTLDLLSRSDRRMRDLASRLSIDASTATRTVGRLVAAGLVERYPAPEDGRVVMVRLTTLGRRRHRAVATRRAHAMDEILRGLEPAECAVLADLFEAFLASVGRFVTTVR